MRNLKTFIGQCSEKIGLFAETVILPEHRRSTFRPCEFAGHQPQPEDVELALMPTTSGQSNQDTEPNQDEEPNGDAQPKQCAREGHDPPSHYPIFTKLILILEVLLKFIVSKKHLIMLFAFDPYRRHEIWRFITIMLVHIGILQLCINAFFQFLLGGLLEVTYGWKRCGTIYLSSVMGGSLFITIFSPKKYVSGASAGVYGLLSSHLTTIIIHWKGIGKPFLRLFGLVLFVACNIGWDVFVDFVTDSNTSHAGHIGGAVTGFLVSSLVLKNFDEDETDEKLKKICLGVIGVLTIIIIVINVTAWDMYAPTEFNFDYMRTYERHLMKLIALSPANSESRQLCEADEYCKEVLDQYDFNGTFSSTF